MTINRTHLAGLKLALKTINAEGYMGENHKRARVLFDVEWYGPTIVMEASKP